MSEAKLYKITQGNKYIILMTGYRGLDVEFYEDNVNRSLWRKFFDLLDEVEKHKYEDEEISKIFAVHPDAPRKFLADNFLNWVRKSHPEIGEFKAEYIGKDASWWFEQFEPSVPDYVEVDENGHWFDKETGEDIDWQRIENEKNPIHETY